MLKALREKRTQLVAAMRGILEAAEAEDRDLTAEEIASYDEQKTQLEGIDQRIERAAAVEDAEAADQAVIPAVARRQPIVRVGGGDVAREFSSLGEFMHAVRFRPNDQRLDFVEDAAAGEDGELHAEMRTDDGPSGGFAIPPQFRQTLMSITPQQAVIRPRATVIEAGSPPDSPVTMPALDQTGSAPGNTFGGVQVQWIDEGGTKPDTDAKLRSITWTPHEVAGTIVVTDKLLRNWQAASSLLETQLRGAVAQSEDFAFLNGNGASKPLGVLKSGALYKVPRATANAVTYDDVIDMVTKLWGRGVFLYSRSMLGALMKLKDSQNRPLWVPSLASGEPPTLAGFPAIENDRNPQLGSLGDLSLVNLGQYVIKDGSGPFVAASEHVYFQQNKTMIKIFWNVDGAPWLTAPFEVDNGDTVSPFVALDVPAA
jgi:HK97 family phage major capsid protein